MLDIRYIRENAAAVQENARRKGYDVSVDEVLRWDKTKRQLQQQADEFRAKRNDISSRMKGGKPTSDLIAEGKAVKDQLAAVETSLKEADVNFTELLKKIPN